jgi:hypothetical protein
MIISRLDFKKNLIEIIDINNKKNKVTDVENIKSNLNT